MREPEEALAVHARAELGVDPGAPGVAVAGGRCSSLVCFLFGALLPVIPWLRSATGTAPTVASVVIGVVAAAVVGALIGRLAERSIARSIVRQVLIVLAACGVTYVIGQAVGVSV